MILKEVCKIAAANGNARLVVSYSGDNKFVVGISDGVTTPLVINGTREELETLLAEQLPGYLATAGKEAAERKVKEEAARHEAALRAAEAKLRQENAARKTAEKKASEENKANQQEFSLF